MSPGRVSAPPVAAFAGKEVPNGYEHVHLRSERECIETFEVGLKSSALSSDLMLQRPTIAFMMLIKNPAIALMIPLMPRPRKG
jgi:hypothetical protein